MLARRDHPEYSPTAVVPAAHQRPCRRCGAPATFVFLTLSCGHYCGGADGTCGRDQDQDERADLARRRAALEPAPEPEQTTIFDLLEVA